MLKLAGLFLFSLPLFAGDYTTYIGGTFAGIPLADDTRVTAMTTDAAGNTYLTGGLLVDPLNNIKGAPPYIAFVTKLDPAGNVLFSRTFGGSGSDEGTAVAVDPSGNIYVAGTTTSPDLLVTNALQTAPNGAFILKLSPNGNSVLYLTYFEGSINAMATDTKGNLYLTGTASSTNFPVTTGQPSVTQTSANYQVAFFTEISAAGDNLLYSGELAPSNVPCPPVPPMASTACPDVAAYAIGTAIAVDSSGNAYIAGNTNGTGLPTTTGVFAPQGIGAFVAKINAGGAGIGYLTYIGSGNNIYVISSYPSTVVNALAIDSSGSVYIAGNTNDPNFPATPGAYQTSIMTSSATSSLGFPLTDAFVARLAPDASHLVWATYVGGEAADSAQSIVVDASGNAWISGTTTSVAFPNATGWSTTGGDFLTEVSSSGAALTYSGRYPTQTVGLAVGLDPVTGLIHAAGPTGIVSGIAPTGTPTMRVFGIVNAAGGETSGRVSGGEMISIYGPHIGTAVPVTATPDSSGELPTTLGGVSVTIPGWGLAHLLYVSDSQINAITPYRSSAAGMQIINGATTSPAFPLEPEVAAPQIFSGADGYAVAVNQDGTINSGSNPAETGTLVSIWATGTGDLPALPGVIATAANNSCGAACMINIYGSVAPGPYATEATVVYAGASPGNAAGLTQIVFRIPAGIPYIIFNLSVDGIASGGLTRLNIRN